MPLIGSNTKTPALYVTAGSGDIAMTNLAAAEAATGVTYNCLEVFNTNVPDWPTWVDPWFASDPSQGYTAWVAADPANRQLIVSYSMIPESAGSMSAPLTWETSGAAGAFSSYATTLATNLVAAGLGSSIIRLGLEMNGNWNIDSVGGSTPGSTVAEGTAWAQTWQQEVTAMRAVPGANFLFCWCPNAVVAGTPFSQYYPGNAYVDIIGIDAYDAFANGSQPAISAATTTSLFAQAYGLTDITAFAVAQGKPLALGEWGCVLGGAGGGLGDDPYYIQGIAAWIAANNVAFHSYFDSNSDNIIPLSSSYPLTLAAYTAAFVPTGLPAVITSAATGVTFDTATLNGSVNPAGQAATYQFEYGTTAGYGTTVPGTPGSAGSGSTPVAESYPLTGLASSATYHYRINATNASGTVHGLDQQFTTPSPDAVTEDASTPPGTYATGSSVTSASFSPPAGSTLLVLAWVIFNNQAGSATDHWTVSDTSTGTWAAGTHVIAAADTTNWSGSALLIAEKYFATAPGSITVTASNSDTGSGGSGIGYTILAVRVLAGAASAQAGQATASGSVNALTSTNRYGSITTTATGSLAYLAGGESYGASSYTAVSGSTSVYNPLIAALGSLYYGGFAHTTADTGTPGATTIGWTAGADAGGTDAFLWVAAEVLPLIVTTVPGTAALSGTGTLGGTGVFKGTGGLSGSGTLAGTGTSAGFGGGAALSGLGTLGGTETGTLVQAAALSGTGTLAGAWTVTLRQAGAALSGTGTLSLAGVTLRYPAALSGNGTLSVLQATGGVVFASPGAATPQAYPLSSQVMVAPPGTSSWTPLGSLGAVTALTYSFTCPGGADAMTCTVMVPAAYRTQLFSPGWQCKITRGGHQVWSGKMDEPVPAPGGWTLTAVGTGNRGADFLAVYSDTWPAGQPDESINGAIGRGLPWVNPGVGTPSGAWFGQAVDSGAQTVTALLGLICTRGGLTWMVNSQPGGYPGDDLTVFPLPTAVNRLLVCTDPAARTLGGDINTIWLRYQTAAASTGSGGSGSAAYGLTSVQDTASVTAHGTLETYIDLSNAGTMSAGSAQAVGSSVLAIYQRAAFAGPFTGHYGQLMNTGGVPIDPGTDQAGTMMKLILADFGYGGEVTPQFPLTFITGAYAWDDLAQQFTVTPYVALDQSLTGLLSMESTVLAPVAASSGTTGG